MKDGATILFDQRWIGPHGIGRFARELFTRIDGVEPLPDALKPLHPLDPIWLSTVIARRRPDVFFTPGFNPPLYCPVPFVFMIHDLIPIRFREETTLAKRIYFATFVRSACRRARRILTVSEYSRREIVAWSGVAPEKVVNVSVGVASNFSPEGVRKELDRPYFFFVGNHKPHKNLNRVIEAYAGSGLSPAVALAVTGTPGAEMQRFVASLGVAESVIFVGEIPEAELAAWYRGAVALVFPTLYEGFGLPALEAMACGTPVITSFTTSLPEVVGDTALIVDPYSLKLIAEAMCSVYRDVELRGRLSSAGLMRAEKFNWNRTALSVSEILSDACNLKVSK